MKKTYISPCAELFDYDDEELMAGTQHDTPEAKGTSLFFGGESSPSPFDETPSQSSE